LRYNISENRPALLSKWQKFLVFALNSRSTFRDPVIGDENVMHLGKQKKDHPKIYSTSPHPLFPFNIFATKTQPETKLYTDNEPFTHFLEPTCLQRNFVSTLAGNFTYTRIYKHHSSPAHHYEL